MPATERAACVPRARYDLRVASPSFLIATAKSDLAFVDKEGREIAALLTRLGEERCRVVAPPDAITNDNFADHLQDGAFTVLHYAGHAGEGSLRFDQGDAHAQGLVATIRECTSLALVFLNGCATREIAEQLTDASNRETRPVPVVIATTSTVSDEAACHFAAKFYEQLARGESIARAFRQARNRTAQKGDWGKRRRDGRHVSANEASDGSEGPWRMHSSYDSAPETVILPASDAHAPAAAQPPADTSPPLRGNVDVKVLISPLEPTVFGVQITPLDDWVREWAVGAPVARPFTWFTGSLAQPNHATFHGRELEGDVSIGQTTERFRFVATHQPALSRTCSLILRFAPRLPSTIWFGPYEGVDTLTGGVWLDINGAPRIDVTARR